MGKNFLRFKRKVKRGALISALLLGFGLGIILLSVLMLIFKLTAIELKPVYYVLGGALSLIVSAVLYLIFSPSDKRLARRLDDTYELDEKISTMIEFKNDEGVFPTLQREDADRRLGEKPMKLMRSKQLVAAILVFTISIGCMAGALVVPAKAVGEEPPIDAFEKEWLIVALEELILTVQNSYMCDELKSDTKDELTSLVDFVKDHDLMSEMKKEAITTIKDISAALAEVNTAVLIGEQFKKSANPNLAAIGKEMADLTGTGTRGAMEDFTDTFADTSYDDLSLLGDEISISLSISGVYNEDSIYQEFKTLAGEMKTASKTELVELFETAGKAISTELIAQNVNRATVSEVNTTLCNLFAISASELDSDIPIIEDDIDRGPASGEGGAGDKEDDDEIHVGSGGIGTGDAIYGSDDVIFDPDTNTYVPYGDIIDEYFGKANEQVLDGKTDDDISDAIENYFGSLYGGNDQNSN